MTQNDILTLKHAIPELHQVLDIGKVIGEGTFSTVYKAQLNKQYHSLCNGDIGFLPSLHYYYAVKHITPVADPLMLQNELECLVDLEGKHNVVQLLFACRNKDHLALVMPYHKHDRFSDLLRTMNIDDVQNYMRELLKSIDHIHSSGIIHRDIKPNNFLYNRKSRQYALVDFGLAQRVADQPKKSTLDQLNVKTRKRKALNDLTTDINKPSKLPSVDDIDITHDAETTLKKHTESLPAAKIITHCGTLIDRKRCTCYEIGKICKDCIAMPAITASRAGTAGYRPPEVLLKVQHQTTAVDMWACGVILFCLLSGRQSCFNAQDDMSALAQIVMLFGRDAVCKAAQKMDKVVNVSIGEQPKYIKSLKTVCEELRQSQVTFKSKKKCTLWDTGSVPDIAYDMLEKLLHLNPDERLTAKEALSHPFLQPSTNYST